MKKTIAVLFALASAAAFAGMNDLIISFSTPGPDKYADGTEVKVGECYSLVYTKIVEGKKKQDIVLNYQTKVAGKCSSVVYIVDEDTAKTYTGGTWGVYLLDTRDFDNGGEPSGLSDGQPKVKPWVKAEVTSSIARSDNLSTAKVGTAVSADSYDLAAVPQPKVTGIRVDNAKVYVTVNNTRPFVGYTLVYGSDTTNFSTPGAEGTPGNMSLDGEIELVTDWKEGAQFFKVSTLGK